MRLLGGLVARNGSDRRADLQPSFEWGSSAAPVRKRARRVLLLTLTLGMVSGHIAALRGKHGSDADIAHTLVGLDLAGARLADPSRDVPCSERPACGRGRRGSGRDGLCRGLPRRGGAASRLVL